METLKLMVYKGKFPAGGEWKRTSAVVTWDPKYGI